MRHYAALMGVEVIADRTAIRGAVSAGITTLPIALAADFDDDGGDINIGGAVINGQLTGGITVAYTARTTDPTGDTLTLAQPLPAGFADRTGVFVSPARLVKIAHVLMAEEWPDGDTEPAIVPSGHLWSDTRLAETARGGQTVIVEHVDTHLEVVGIPGSAPMHDAAFLDPNSTAPAGPIRNAALADPAGLAGAIPADAIAPGVLPPGVTVGGLVHDDQGTRMLNPDGSAAFDVPTDGRPARTTGIGDFEKIATHAGGQLGGPIYIPAGSTVILGTGVSPPPIAPSSTPSWATQPIGFSMPSRQRFGRADKSLTEAYTLMVDKGGTTRVVVFNPTPGTQVGRYPLTGAPTATTVYSIAYSRLVDKVATLEWDAVAAQWLVRYYTLGSGVYVYASQWVWAEGGAVETPRPAFSMATVSGHEYTRIGRSNADGTATIREYADHVLDSSKTGTTPVLNLGDLMACAYFGGTVILTGVTNPVYPAGMPFPAAWLGLYPNRPVMPVININFVGSPGDVLGWGVVGNRDVAAAGVSVIDSPSDLIVRYLSSVTDRHIAHSNLFERGRYDVAARWYNSSTGTFSDIGPVTTMDKIPGSILTVGTGPPPPGYPADSIQVFMGPQGGTLYLQNVTGTNPSGASTPGTYTVPVFTIATTGTTPGAGTMTGGTPGALKTQGGTLLADGSGYIAGGGGTTDNPYGAVYLDPGLADGTGGYLIFDDGMVS